MSILIRGMKMPKNCWNCPFFHTSLHHIGDDELLERHTCLRTGERTDENVIGYLKNCPLVELPPRIVFCIECKHRGYKDFNCYCESGPMTGIVKPWDYCSHGVLKEELKKVVDK